MKNNAIAIDEFIKNLNLSKIQYVYPEKDSRKIKNYRRGNPCGYPLLWDNHHPFSSMAGGGNPQ